ncbi:MAG TPA: carboxypeptidase regulatory-like domain-containing protein [Candidatus Sulfotelmatobacter sp.]|nr:carboxypeptidase regulatory-like domain-containing protein [Candidatus Sulfotelmatobacter sp.]
MTLKSRSVGALLCLVLCALPLLAQTSGSFTGTVADGTGAAVVGAQVSVSNPSTGLRRKATSNSDGNYLVAGLDAGRYDITIAAPGFRTFVAKQLILRVGEKIRVDTSLQIGKVTSEIVVEGSSVGKVETQTSELAGTITGEQITQLELNGRDFATLIKLIPGVSDQTGQDDGTVGPAGSVSYAVNGGRTEFNNWQIDGGEVLDSGSNANINVYPNIDALAEVRVLTSTYGAQYGRNGSGTIEAVTKSGTNRFHGDAFEFIRNAAFNAHNYFDVPGQAKTYYNKNDFGYIIGGPIKKDKLFFFWSQEFRRENVPYVYNNQTLFLPDTAERGGNFGEVCPAAGTPFVRAGVVPVSTPSGQEGVSVNCPAYTLLGQDSNGNNYYQGFPDNMIPSNLMDPANTNPLVANIPFPNDGDNFIGTFAAPISWHEELIKIDDQINPKLRASFRFIHDSWTQKFPFSPGTSNTTNVPAIGGTVQGPGISIVMNLTATLSPILMNEFVFSYGSNHLHLFNTGSAWKRPASMTMTGIFENGFNGTIPQIALNGGNFYSSVDPGYLPWTNSNPTYSFHENLTWIRGKHNLAIGTYFEAIEKNEPALEEPNGSLTFYANPNTAYSEANPSKGPFSSTGNAFADLLVGAINNFAQPNQNLKYYNRYKVVEPFLQDDWHVTRRLTLNLGVRVSLFGSYYERYGHAYNFDPNAYVAANAPVVDPNTGALDFAPGQSVNTMTGMVHCGYNRVHSSCMSGHLFNPAPRFGFAFDPKGDGKTALRGGYGIFFEHANGNDANTESLEGNPPGIIAPVQLFISGYTNIGGTSPSGQPLLYPLGGGNSQLTSITTKTQWPYVQQYHLDIQREVARDTMVVIAYVGSKGTHLSQQLDRNQLHSVPASQNPYAPGQYITGADCNNIFNTPPTLGNGTLVTGQALINLNVACGNVNTDMFRPYQGYDSIYGIIGGANSSYNALQVSGRRNAGGLQLTVAYTYSHSIDNSSDRYDSAFVDSYNLNSYRASSAFDQRHIFTVSYIYNLPIFRHSKGLTGSLLGGWQVSGITTAQSGEPFSIVNGGAYDNAGVGNSVGSGSYADLVGDPHGPKPSFSQVPGVVYGPLLYNPGAYTQPTGLTFGDSGRNSLAGPGRLNFDMGVFKRFRITESKALEFRAEAFNVFNHPQWTGVNNSSCGYVTDSGSANSGSNDCVNGNANNGEAPSNFLHPSGVHIPRIGEFGLKFIF